MNRGIAGLPKAANAGLLAMVLNSSGKLSAIAKSRERSHW